MPTVCFPIYKEMMLKTAYMKFVDATRVRRGSCGDWETDCRREINGVRQTHRLNRQPYFDREACRHGKAIHIDPSPDQAISHASNCQTETFRMTIKKEQLTVHGNSIFEMSATKNLFFFEVPT
jgi:hypothetical protein